MIGRMKTLNYVSKALWFWLLNKLEELDTKIDVRKFYLYLERKAKSKEACFSFSILDIKSLAHTTT